MPGMAEWMYWVIAIAVFSFIEVITPQFVTLWFAAGSAVAMIFALAGLPVIAQVIAFIVSSAVFLIVTRPLYDKFIKTRQVATNTDSLIGKTAIVTDDIDNDEGVGFVKVSGQIWSARTSDGTLIVKGEKVKVLSIEGVKLIVEKYSKED